MKRIFITLSLALLALLGVSGTQQAWAGTVDCFNTQQTWVPVETCLALKGLYEATNGPGWSRQDRWLTDTPVGTWQGVSVGLGLDANGLMYVTAVDLSDNQLEGVFPPTGFWQNLPKLMSLNLSKNPGLKGNLGIFLGGCANVRSMKMHDTSVGGGISSTIKSCSVLRELNLARSKFSGPLPSGLGFISSLEKIDLSGNSISGRIPPSWAQLSSLTLLNLSHNFLSFTVADQLYPLMLLKKLERVNFSGNLISGSIPAFVAGSPPQSQPNFPALLELSMRDNLISGAIPQSLSVLKRLRKIDFAQNQLRGPIPNALGLLTSLEIFLVDDNYISGSVANLPHLIRDVQQNNVALNCMMPDPAAPLIQGPQRAPSDCL